MLGDRLRGARERLARDGGFGLIELVIAMTVLAVAILALAAGFSSGFVALDRASRLETAGALADRQLETYRRLLYTSIRLDTSLVPAPDATYTGDAALAGGAQTGTVLVTGACSSGVTASCQRVQSPVTGPDGHAYRIDSYVVWYCPVGNIVNGGTAAPSCAGAVTAPVKKVTVVVRDAGGAAAGRVLVRQSSTYDPTTGS